MNESVKLKSTIIELPFAVIIFRKEGFIHLHYKEHQLTLQDSQIVFDTIRKNSPWENYPVLVSNHELAIQEKEAREFNSSNEVIKNCTAIAFVVNNLAQRILFNFYARLFQSKMPAKCFSSAESATEWLKPYTKRTNE